MSDEANSIILRFVAQCGLIALITFSLTMCDQAHADEVHLAAHLGTSFALQTVFYGVNEKWLGLSKRDAEVLAFVATMAVGLAYKVNEGTPQGTAQSMEENAVGAALAVGVHYTFEF